MKLLLVLWIIALCSFQLVEADENILYSDLIRGYNKRIRPKINHKETVEVMLDFELRQIIDLNEKEQILTFVGFFTAASISDRPSYSYFLSNSSQLQQLSAPIFSQSGIPSFVHDQRWKDDHMIWNPTTHGDIESMVIPPDIIWLPDMGIENSADRFYHDTFRENFHVRLYYDGSVQWTFGGQIHTLCDLDMTYYPFDLQKCVIVVENWVYHGHEVQLRNKSDVIETDAYLQHGLWDLVRTSSEHENMYYLAIGREPHPEVRFTLYLKRKSQFYVVNLVLPCILIILVALGVFWLPAESGEKVSLAVTLLLAFSVFQIVLVDSLPANSDYKPVLAQLVMGIMTLSAISVLTSILILYLHFKDPEMPVPQCLRGFFFRFLAAAVCLHGSAPEDMSDQVSPSAETSIKIKDIENAKEKTTFTESSDPDIARISQNLEFIVNKMKATQRDEKIVNEWRFLAVILDRILFWVSVVVSLIILLVFLVREDVDH